ncbi:MAG: ribbon-helix-helix protein, CopG family [Chloroflexi bacterium]|nr:ribbon-helix-helix protein, CopG family [Chloroflexota bacterium]
MVKVLVSLDERLLERMDQEARTRGLSRSALIAEMANDRLGQELGPGARPEVQEALRNLKELFRDVDDPVDSTQVIREMRDARWGTLDDS